MFLYEFENVDFKKYSVLLDAEPAHQRHKLFPLPKPTEHFPLMIRDSDYNLPFCAKDFFILLNDTSSILGLSTFSGLSFSCSISIVSILTRESISYCFTSSSLLTCLVLLMFSEPLN